MRLNKKAGLAGLSSALILFSSAVPAFANPDSQPAVKVQSTESVSVGKDVRVELAKPILISTDGVLTAAGDGKSPPVEAKISKDDAIELVRKQLQISDDYKVGGVNFSGNYPGFGKPGESFWNIYFTKRIQDRYIGNFNVTIGADTGRLINWNKYENDPEKRALFPPKVDLQKAKEIALQYLQSVNPEEIKQTRYNDTFEQSFQTPLTGEVAYVIRYDRTVNGIPFQNNGLTVNVNGNGDITGYQYNWDDTIKFEDASGAISREQADEIVQKETTADLAYVLPYQQNENNKPIPSYQLDIKPIDAKTGKTWRLGGDQPEKSDKTPLAESPLADKPNPEKPLSKEQAIEAVTSILGLPEGLQVEDANYGEYQTSFQTTPSGIWNIRWRYTGKEDPKRNLLLFAGVDAFTGQVRNFNKQDERFYAAGSSGETLKVSFDEAKAKAVEIVKKAAPFYANQLYLKNSINPSKDGFYPSYQFQYTRAVDGVDTPEGIGVNIDPNTGEVISFFSSISNTAYPEHKPDVIDQEKARETLLSQYKLELSYVLQPKNPGQGPIGLPYNIPYEKYSSIIAAGGIPPQSPAVETEGKLVYLPVFKYQGNSYDLFLDAVTGQWRQRSTGQEAQLGKPQATDISGNPAEQALRLLVEYRALDLKDGKVNPDQVITRGEVIKALIIAVNGWRYPIHYDNLRQATFSDVAKGSTYYAYVESAADQNLIDRNQKTFRPEDPLTREDLAELLVRALGYNQLAGQTDLFRLNAADADQISRKGQTAIVIGLGILPAVEGKFLPGEKVTRADAAQAFYRYLEKRATLQERQVFYGGY